MSNYQKIEQHFNNIIENYSKTNQKQAIEFIKIYRGFFSELVKTNAFIGKEKDLFKIINEHLSNAFLSPSTKFNEKFNDLEFEGAKKIIDEICDINLNENNN